MDVQKQVVALQCKLRQSFEANRKAAKELTNALLETSRELHQMLRYYSLEEMLKWLYSFGMVVLLDDEEWQKYPFLKADTKNGREETNLVNQTEDRTEGAQANNQTFDPKAEMKIKRIFVMKRSINCTDETHC